MLKLFVIGISFAAALAQAPAQPPADTAPPKPNDYADGKTWLCRPGRQDACAIDHTRPSSKADGKMTGRRGPPTRTRRSTASTSTRRFPPTRPNSDMTADPAERNVVAQQFARFASKCRPYAPLYRQVTIAGLRQILASAVRRRSRHGHPVRRRADAWNYYLQNDNHGRGVVLVGSLAGLVHADRADSSRN